MYKIEHLGKEILKMMLTVEERLIQHSVTKMCFGHTTIYALGGGTIEKTLPSEME